MNNITDRFAENAVQYNNNIRPFFQAPTEHDPSLATIILLTDTVPNTKEEINRSKDYFTSFSAFIGDITQAVDIAVPALTSAIIPRLDIMETKGVTEYFGLFNNFSLVNVVESKEQMVKVQMNFGGSWNAFFFGDKPTIYSFNGFFLDSKEYPYYQEFITAYDNYLSGRKCIENKFQMMIAYDGRIIDGYILGINTTVSSGSPFMKSFSFNVLVKNENWYRTNIVRTATGEIVSGLNYMSSARARYSTAGYTSMIENANG